MILRSRIYSTILLTFVIFPFANAQNNKLEITIDEGTELITTVQLLSGYKYLAPANHDYKKTVRAKFETLKDHEAVRMYSRMSSWFYGVGPIQFMTHYDPENFKEIIPFGEEDEIAFSYSSRKDTLAKFKTLLANFYRKSKFHSFYADQKKYYQSISASVLATSQKIDFIAIMESHFGAKEYAYRVILSPLQMDAGFGATLKTEKGNILYAFIGPRYNSKDTPVFDSDPIFRDLVLHEFSHAFCNPQIDRFYSKLAEDSCLFEPIAAAMKEQGYSSWKVCLYEHWTRANEVVMAQLAYGNFTQDSLVYVYVEEDKWIYLEPLVQIVEKEYLADRTTHQNLGSVMGYVVAYFNNERKKCR